MKLRQSALAAVLIVLAGCGSGASSPSASSASPGVPSSSPSATAESSVQPIGTVRFPFGDWEMEVEIVGQQGIVVAWRGATDRELRTVVWDENGDIGLGRLGDRELVLGWTGTVCDVEATLIVTPGSLVVSPPPREGCDAMAVGRGIVLTYAASVDPADIDVRLMETVLLPESS